MIATPPERYNTIRSHENAEPDAPANAGRAPCGLPGASDPAWLRFPFDRIERIRVLQEAPFPYGAKMSSKNGRKALDFDQTLLKIGRAHV